MQPASMTSTLSLRRQDTNNNSPLRISTLPQVQATLSPSLDRRRLFPLNDAHTKVQSQTQGTIFTFSVI